MRHPGSFKPASIANRRFKVQIVDTHESPETRVSIGFAACWHQMNRTLLISYVIQVEGAARQRLVGESAGWEATRPT